MKVDDDVREAIAVFDARIKSKLRNLGVRTALYSSGEIYLIVTFDEFEVKIRLDINSLLSEQYLKSLANEAAMKIAKEAFLVK